MDRTRPLRTVPVTLLLIAAPAVLFAQSAPAPISAMPPPIEYRLGGAATFEAQVPATVPLVEDAPRLSPFRFPDRVPSSLLDDGQSRTFLGDVSVFGRELAENGEEMIRLGTALTRGRTTTGVAFSYGDETELTRSELFLDYALTDAFSVGVSGILTDDREALAPPTTRLGVSASYAFDSGTFVQGGIADAPDTSPVFGVSLGLRF